MQETNIDSIFDIPSQKYLFVFLTIRVLEWEKRDYSIVGIFFYINILNWWIYEFLVLKLWSEQNGKKDKNINYIIVLLFSKIQK